MESTSSEQTPENRPTTIRLIDFIKFQHHGAFPRYPDNSDIVTTLDEIDRDQSLIVFISHCWLRGHSNCEGWDGRPHPDDVDNNKYKLCVTGIEHILNIAPRMKNCYVWLDFGCLDQDGSTTESMIRLDKIVECCDVIFTPIYDPKEDDWSYPNGWTNYFEQYLAKAWNDGPQAYLNRGWCRVEMFYAANIPILENSNPDVKRHTQFDAGLRVLTEKGHRPHMLYGTKEHLQRRQPWTLPPLQNSYLQKMDPKEGYLTKPEDTAYIAHLMAELQPYLTFVTEGYVGETNEDGQKHGRGKYTWDTGMVYDGEWRNDVFHGKGVLYYASGDKYVGELADGMFNGYGVLEYSGNGTYRGYWKNNLYNGQGRFDYPNGQYYEGPFVNGNKHGEGIEDSGTVVYEHGHRCVNVDRDSLFEDSEENPVEVP